MKIEHPNKLLETPNAILIIDLLEQASYIIDEHTEQFFVESPKGLYIKGHVNPIMLDGKKYYPKSKYSDDHYLISYINALEQEEDIVDDKDKVILNLFNIKNRPYLFTQQPQLPVSAINACYSILIDYLFRYCKHARGLKVKYIGDYIKEEYNHYLYENYFESKISDALDELHEFIRKNDWNIYFHKLKGTTLIIEQHVDYRIYSWTEMMYKEQEEEEELDIYGI